MYIAVSGNLGSGKSTLARGLSRAFNCPLFPRQSYDKTYIDDLFQDPTRWTTEAQISFLVHKQTAILQGMRSGRLFILDRSLGEDAEVFAERFHDDGTIDDRSIGLIRQLYQDLSTRIDPPSLIIFCDCPPEICQKRLKARPRSYQPRYPKNHLQKLDIRLRAWASNNMDAAVLRVDSVMQDFRDDQTVDALAFAVERFVRSASAATQPDLFSASDRDSGADPSNEFQLMNAASAQIALTPNLIRPTKVYLAAPFTNKAGTRDIGPQDRPSLFSGSEYIETIPNSYRRQLSGLCRAIESHGHQVLLPHRDINRWGSRALPPRDIAARCLTGVQECDCFLGLIGESFGSHAELGYALGLGKPCIVLTADKVATSFFGSGVGYLSEVRQIRSRSLTDLIRKLREKDPLSLFDREGTGA